MQSYRFWLLMLKKWPKITSYISNETISSSESTQTVVRFDSQNFKLEALTKRFSLVFFFSTLIYTSTTPIGIFKNLILTYYLMLVTKNTYTLALYFIETKSIHYFSGSLQLELKKKKRFETQLGFFFQDMALERMHIIDEQIPQFIATIFHQLEYGSIKTSLCIYNPQRYTYLDFIL